MVLCLFADRCKLKPPGYIINNAVSMADMAASHVRPRRQGVCVQYTLQGVGVGVDMVDSLQQWIRDRAFASHAVGRWFKPQPASL